MYANCEQVLRKELWGNLSHKMSTNCVSSTQSLTLIPYEFSYLYWQSPITVSSKVKSWLIHCIMWYILIFKESGFQIILTKLLPHAYFSFRFLIPYVVGYLVVQSYTSCESL